jgi:hypothetical protein
MALAVAARATMSPQFESQTFAKIITEELRATSAALNEYR